MFGDQKWIDSNTVDQQHRFVAWVGDVPLTSMVVVEIGAGTAVPTVRWESESKMHREEATLIRINPRESEGPEGTISVASGGLEALRKIGDLL